MLITETFQDVPTKADGNGNIRKKNYLYSNPSLSSLVTIFYFIFFFLSFFSSKLYIIHIIFKGGGKHMREDLFFYFIYILILLLQNPFYRHLHLPSNYSKLSKRKLPRSRCL